MVLSGTEARILVVGSRGYGGFAGLLLGSVSAACAEPAPGAILVIHGETPPPPTAQTPKVVGLTGALREADNAEQARGSAGSARPAPVGWAIETPTHLGGAARSAALPS